MSFYVFPVFAIDIIQIVLYTNISGNAVKKRFGRKLWGTRFHFQHLTVAIFYFSCTYNMQFLFGCIRHTFNKADFIAKLQIALKECYETDYWMELFRKAGLLSEKADAIQHDCGVLRRILISSLNTAKGKHESPNHTKGKSMVNILLESFDIQAPWLYEELKNYLKPSHKVAVVAFFGMTEISNP